MVDRRQFIQTFLTALVAVSLPSLSRATALANPTLPSSALRVDGWPTAMAEVFAREQQIKLIGVGGGGCNAVWHMIDTRTSGIEYVFANTDMNELNRCSSHKTIELHRNKLSARTKRGRCRETAELAASDIRAALEGTHLLFITVGLGGRTGTEAAPVIARIAKEMGIEMVALVTLPFTWEGVRRSQYANSGLAKLQSCVNTVIVLPNDKLLDVLDSDATIEDAFFHANEMIKNTVVGMARIVMSKPGKSPKLTPVIHRNPDQDRIVSERALASLFLKTGIF